MRKNNTSLAGRELIVEGVYDITVNYYPRWDTSVALLQPRGSWPYIALWDESGGGQQLTPTARPYYWESYRDIGEHKS